MSTIYQFDYTKIHSKLQLLDWFQTACKKKTQVGLEVEVFCLDKNFHPLPYQSQGASILKILTHLAEAMEGEIVLEGENPIALSTPTGMVSLEPGGQLEYGMRPFTSLTEMEKYLFQFFSHLSRFAEKWGTRFLFLGFEPLHRKEDIPWMPKKRYVIMREYLPKKGELALEMMLQSASLQASFDYESEEDMAEKFRTAQALVPFLIALFANSPFRQGRLSYFESFRAQVWQKVDPDRCGLLPQAMREDFRFSHYMEYLLDLPMMFIVRKGKWLPMEGISFRHFLENGACGHHATLGDWTLQSSAAFLEVRLRPWLEVRSPDLVPPSLILSFPAFLKGILYSPKARKQTLELLSFPSLEVVEKARQEACRKGLFATYDRTPILDLAREILKISKESLLQSAKEEVKYLQPLFLLLEKEKTTALELVEKVKKKDLHQLSQKELEKLFHSHLVS